MRDPRIHTSRYADILHQALTDGQYVEMVHFYAMSASLNVVLQTYIPPSMTMGLLDSPFTSMVVGRGVQTAAPHLTVMWTLTEVNYPVLHRRST